MGQLKFQVDQLWGVIFKNAQVELVRQGAAKIQSPIHIVTEAFEPIKPYLALYLPIYQKIKAKSNGLSDGEIERRLFQGLEREAGDSIIQNVALPNNLSFGASIMLVIQACQYAEEISHL